MADFGDAIRAITSKEMAEARQARDADRMGAAVEAIARTLGFCIAIATNGNPKGIDEMIAGAEAYAHEEAVQKAKFARLFELSIGKPT